MVGGEAFEAHDPAEKVRDATRTSVDATGQIGKDPSQWFAALNLYTSHGPRIPSRRSLQLLLSLLVN